MFPQVQADYVQCQGGLNLTQPTIVNAAGYLSDALNYECATNGGYKRIAGYERYDGQESPTLATYWLLACTITGSIVAGNTVTGGTSGATGYVLALYDSGVVIASLTGSFEIGESLNGGAATVTAEQSPNAAGSTYYNAYYSYLAAEVQRALIQAVPGQGSVLGVWRSNGVLYAFRNFTGGTECRMYAESPSGWAQVDLGREIAFTAGGATEPAVGSTLSRGGVTATILRVVRESGTWATNTAAGRLILDTPSGTFTAGAATVGGINLTLSGAQSSITLSPNGKFSFDNYSFVTGERMYGCNGIDREFEFDGTVFVPLETGGTVKGSYIVGHSKHLIIATGTSLTISAIGNPYNFEVINGAAEIGVGDSVTGLLKQPGTSNTAALVTYTRNDTNILYGTSAADFQLVTFQQNIGAFAGSAQSIGTAYSLDERGIIQIGASQNYGNFDHATISRLYTPFIDTYKAQVAASSVWRSSNQYRLFFNNGYGLYVTLNGNQTVGACPVKFPHVVTCTCGDDTADGEVGFFGTTDGYVMQFNRGASFDGLPVEALMTFPYHGAKSHLYRKAWKRGRLDAVFAGYAEMSMQPSLGYGGTDPLQPRSEAIQASAVSASWDNGNWDRGNWDGKVTPVKFSLSGTSEAISLTIYSNSAITEPFVVHGFFLNYLMRRAIR